MFSGACYFSVSEIKCLAVFVDVIVSEIMFPAALVEVNGALVEVRFALVEVRFALVEVNFSLVEVSLVDVSPFNSWQ